MKMTSWKHKGSHSFQIAATLLFILFFVANTSYSQAAIPSSPASTIPVGDGPHGIVFDPLNGCLYVTNFEAGTISVINGSTNSVVATIDLHLRASPWEVAFNPNNGHIYVTDTYSGKVSVINGENNS